MSEIHFCDLCNESVPDGDLQIGRAFLVKGRVVCANCNRAMSSEPDEMGVASGPVLEPAGSGATLSAPAPAVHAPRPHAHSRSSGGTALAIGATALVLTVVLGYWLTDQLHKHEQRADESAAAAELAEQRTHDAIEAARRELRESMEALQQRIGTDLDGQKRALETRMQEQARTSADLAKKLAESDPQFARLADAIQQLANHERSLAELQAQRDNVSREMLELASRLDREMLAARERATPQPAAAPIEQKPAWSQLVDLLSSTSVSDRWQAVVALGETRDQATAPHIIGALKDEDVFVRIAAARALGDLGSVAAVEPLIATMSDPKEVVREAAYGALKSITKRDFPFDPFAEDSGERSKRIKAWREWWEKERGKYGV